jgi:hypothetical protein
MRFSKGQSGNPMGKPKGAKDKRTALRTLLLPHAEDLVKKAVDLALAGDTTALRICIDRIIPMMKAKDSGVRIGKLEGSLTDQGRTVLTAMSEGSITPDEASTLMQAIGVQARIIAVDELEQRVSAIEERQRSQQEGQA